LDNLLITASIKLFASITEHQTQFYLVNGTSNFLEVLIELNIIDIGSLKKKES